MIRRFVAFLRSMFSPRHSIARGLLARLAPVMGGVDALPRFAPSFFKTYTCSAATLGGRLCEATGDRTVQTGTANSARIVGVAHRDGALNEQVAVGRLATYIIRGVGPITAGDRLKGAADGRVTLWDDAVDAAELIVGYACDTVADGADCEVNLTV